MGFKNRDLNGAILIAAINLGWAQLSSSPLVISIILGLPLVFVLPGYTLTHALFRKRSPDPTNNLILKPSLKFGQPVGAVDYILLSLGLSMAIDVFVGFMLNVLPMGLQRQSWTIALGLVTIIFALLAMFLRRKNGVKSNRGKIVGTRVTPYQFMLFGIAMLVATVAIGFSVIRPPATQVNFTQLWMLPSTHANNSCEILIGVQSNESTPMSYRIVVKINGTQVYSWSSVMLSPLKKWEQSVPIKSKVASAIYVEAQLYLTDKQDGVYRDVHLIMHKVKEGEIGQEQQCTT